MGIQVSWEPDDEWYVSNAAWETLVEAVQGEIQRQELNEEDCVAFVHPASQPPCGLPNQKFTWVPEAFIPRCETWVVTRESLREGFFRVFG
jgi:hypothetical protein